MPGKPGESAQPAGAPPEGLDETFRFYRVTEPQVPQVTRFLTHHPFLLPILLDAREPLRRFFGDAPVHLEATVDPEDGWELLWGRIAVDRRTGDALELLRGFDREWFTEADRGTDGRLNYWVW